LKRIKASSRLLAVVTVAASPGFFLGTTRASDRCQDFSGTWQSKDLAVSEMRLSQAGCKLEGSFKVTGGGSKKGFKHQLKATATGSTAAGSVTRTDPGGCKAQLDITLAMEGGHLVYRTTHTDGACGLAAGFTERRDWQRVVSTRSVLVFRCPDCGAVLGKCAGNEPGGTCIYCKSPSRSCRCPYCNGAFYEISHRHDN
jgi:hypothetical protein